MAAKKAAAVPVTPEMIDKAARTTTVKDLVKLAEAFVRAGAHGPFPTELPIFGPCAVRKPEEGVVYRRHNIPVGTRVNASKITIGKRDGLIFVLPIEGEWVCDKGPVEWIELGWDDVINSFADLADRIEGYLDGVKVAEIQASVKDAIAKNPAMHKILTEGFVLAQTHKKEDVAASVDQEHPLWGQF
ncbi:hypothetical protein [Sphingomonas sp. ACRSK]|uniref:hypothetical protein n=1 Tax=Sphingomonas sp. ACRSK TaxID=2918213 RepID=UPI001EF441DE|nr:hypothetical protein [Sphingomonas sp. ACRSK]MCG7348893.1 hypothetical protein [Sphingomonas sp. ACRSK]